MSQDVIRVTLNSSVEDSASFFAPYPDDRNANIYAVTGHYVRSNRYGTQHHGEDANFVLGLDGATITNNSGESLAAGTTLYVNLVFAEVEEDAGTTPPVNVEPQLAAIRSDLADTSGGAGKGAGAVGYSNDGSKHDGAETVQAALDDVDATRLKTSAAQDAVAADRFVGGDVVFGATAAGQVIMVDFANVADTSVVDKYEFFESPFLVLPEHAGRLGVNRVAGNAEAVFSLQSEQEYLPASHFRLLHRGSGTFKGVCGDASIQINEASDAEIVAENRGDMLEFTNVGPDDWSATGKQVTPTTDTTPPAVFSVSPANGSTILPDTVIQVTMTESVQVDTGLITQRQRTGGGAFEDDGTIDVTAPAGKMSVSNNVISIHAANARVEGDDYSYRIAAGAFTDVSENLNAFAGVLDDVTIGPFTVALSAPSAISVVDSKGFRIDAGPVSPPDVTKTMTSTPATGDMTIQFAVAPLAIAGGPPDGMTNFYDSTSASNPGSYAVYRIEGGTPSSELAYTGVYNFRQAAGYMVVRGSGGTLSPSGGEFNASSTAVEAANADPYTPLTDGELVFAVYTIDTKDVAITGAALLSAGFSIAINQTTEQGSTTAGCTLLVAYKEDCPIGVPVDPPAVESGNVIYRAWTLGIKET